MILKNLTDNAKNLAANAKMEDMSRLIKNMAGKQDVKNALSGVMVHHLVLIVFYTSEILAIQFFLIKRARPAWDVIAPKSAPKNVFNVLIKNKSIKFFNTLMVVSFSLVTVFC